MEKLNLYRNVIKKILTEYEQLASQTPNPEGVDSILAFDEQRDQYLWFQTGWQNDHKIRGITVYVRIKNEKIYIEEDWTEEGIATELLREGVPKEDIVLAFHDPETRKFTEFAVA
ncbi:MAG: XisI protein [Dolichospermum sp.]|uniref:FdxN element excision controlling factor protein n=2 Tax=Sphaerospermopsis TaxID=752201 RepID=A0A479ZV62_9CYAN|nr:MULTISPECIES: XisI protein [Sphaerospermopsis]MBD2144683.1 XisI protein [Sphaerospermopsis sp. FACHB-1194]MBE9239400.1 XisI protein [Sphaerospermopsis aphanizomenoides LEGE 00250]MEB3149272.1 XisI protein [Sphaerospermopsis sp.]GCL35476.1 fdxN element excision controlling factor protein [Sphaerospermopsis reniformis]